jgi:hypothetical protein
MITGGDIRNGTLTSADIARGSVKSSDVADGTLRKKDFKPGVLTAPADPQTAPSTVTELRSWNVHFDAAPSGYAEDATSTEALPAGTLISAIDVQGIGDASACPRLTVQFGAAGAVHAMWAERNSGEAWRAHLQDEVRVAPGSTGKLVATAQCQSGFMGNAVAMPAFDVTILFETTSPAAGPATPLS